MTSGLVRWRGRHGAAGAGLDITLDMAIEALESAERGGQALLLYEWGMWPETRRLHWPWTDADFARLREQTSCTVPTQLEQLLRRYVTIHAGSSDWDAPQHVAFRAEWEDGSRSTHAVKTLVDLPQAMLDTHAIFCGTGDMPYGFRHNMIFFGDADGGHAALLMNGTDPNDNAVYLWLKSSHPHLEDMTVDGIGRCADTLYAFIHDLTLEESL